VSGKLTWAIRNPGSRCPCCHGAADEFHACLELNYKPVGGVGIGEVCVVMGRGVLWTMIVYLLNKEVLF